MRLPKNIGKWRLVLLLKEPIAGYWDGGAKRRFEFEIEEICKDGKGLFARIGCWDANYWFHVNGKGTEKQIFANVRRKFADKFRGIECEWRYEKC